MEELEHSILETSLKKKKEDLINDYYKFIHENVDKLKSLIRYGAMSSDINILRYSEFISSVMSKLFDMFDIEYYKVLCYLKNKKIEDKANYISYEVNIFFIEKESSTEEAGNISFNMNELYSNCSSIVVRNINNSYLIKSEIMFDLFMYAINELIFTAFNYSNIFYTISSESNRYFYQYCTNHTKSILNFRNKRNTHEIIYYSLLRNINKEELKEEYLNFYKSYEQN